MELERLEGIVPDHGAGATLWDREGRGHIDFAGGENTLGHGSERWVGAVAEQAVKLAHCPPGLTAESCARLTQVLEARSGLSRALLYASGGEAEDALLRLARRYSRARYGKGRGTVLALKGGYHGPTLAALSAVGREDLDDQFRTAEPTLDGVEAVAGHDVCAVLLELTPREAGGRPHSRTFLHDLAVLCAERDWLLLIDEAGTGVGRTGSLFAYQQYGVLPDGVALGASLAGGLPLGALLVSDKCAGALAGWDGREGSYPLCAGAALAVLDELDETALRQVEEKGTYLRTALEAVVSPCLGKVWGMGLLLGAEVREPYDPRELVRRLAEGGLLCGRWEGGLTFAPPLAVTRQELDQGLAALRRTLGELEENG